MPDHRSAEEYFLDTLGWDCVWEVIKETEGSYDLTVHCTYRHRVP